MTKDAQRRLRDVAPLVGRAQALARIEQTLDEVTDGSFGGIELVGETGIGKTRLLSELAAQSELRGHRVLSAAASELERELPFSVFVHALDDYLQSSGLDLRSALPAASKAELAHIFPSLAALAESGATSLQHERYRSHRAVQALLELLAGPTPLVLVLDDFHWADPASIELFDALLRRPPAAPVLIAVALRPGETKERFRAALARAERASVLMRIELGPLTLDESRTLLGDRIDAGSVALLHRESGGNPFYLEQLVRAAERTGGAISGHRISLSGLGVPGAVASALSEELTLLSDGGRTLLSGAAVAGDPFELEVAIAAAGTSEPELMEALDELLGLGLIRAADTPRRFRFRHPLVRRAVYEATPGGWRLSAHERCAEALVERRASVTARAHHVERSARQGDAEAAALLREAGEEAVRLAPESAAHWFAGALRLLPQAAPGGERVGLLLQRAEALAAVGHFTDAHGVLLEAVAIVPPEPRALRTSVATACAGVERFLGRYEQAHSRLLSTLRELPDPASTEAVELLIELTLNEFYRSSYDAMRGWADRALAGAEALDEEALRAAALAMPALAHALTGQTDLARSHRAEAAALIDELSDNQLSARPDAAGWLAIAEVYLDLYAEADTHATRALALASSSGRGDPLHRLYPVAPRVWYVRGKLAEAAECLDGAIEAGRLLGSPPALAGNLFNRANVALAAGDLDLALAVGVEAVELTRDLDEGFVAAWAGARHAAVLLELNESEQALELLLARAGGEELPLIPGGWRVRFLELLTRCWLALDRGEEADRAAALAEATAATFRLPLATAWADRALAAVSLHSGDHERAVERALASAAAAREAGAPIEEALSRTVAGRGLARAGEKGRAVSELQLAAATFERCGALRYRAEAERELGKLGRRPHRRTRAGNANGKGIATLTGRELQLTRLVVERKTNPEIAGELFLSQKTVEHHLRNIFRKVGVSSRVELARAVERSDADDRS